jgi:ABC-type transport system involved in multi-copper enzyme maturation permease subunit
VSALAEGRTRAGPAVRRWPFFAQEYLRIMRGRLALLIWVLLVYSVAVVPFMMAKPAPEVLHTIAAWLGPTQAEVKLILFTWVDAAMNKLVVILGPVLAGGIIAEERARGTLDLLTAKPIGAGDYFTVKLGATAAAFATFYVAAVMGAIATFPWRVAGFDVADFAALSVVHLFAGLFAVGFSAAMAVSFERKLTGMLVSVAVLGTLVGLAFLGLIYPAYRAVSYLNPFFHGIILIASIDGYGTSDVLRPIVWLLGFNLAVAWLGRRRAVQVLEHG